MICFQQVSKGYFGGIKAIQNINFHIRPAEMVFLTGHSNAGKSTILKLICGLERPSAGHVFVCSHNISRLKYSEIPFLRRKIGLIFPNQPLLLDQTVYENVTVPLVITNTSIQDIHRRVSAALDKLDLLDKARYFIEQLSSCEKQRVNIARALVNKPVILLADDPTGNLDDIWCQSILRLFEEFNRFGVTILIATHDIRLINRKKNRVLTLKQGRMCGDIYGS